MTGQRHTALIVDHAPSNLALLFKALIAEGIDVTAAESGEAALEILRETTPDIILLDVVMPRMDGYALCGRIKQNKRLANIPVIFVTAKDTPEEVTQGFEADAVDYITKPFNPAEVVARVQTHLRLHDTLARLDRANAELAREVADRKRAEEELRAAHAETERLLSAISSIVISLNDKDEITRWNATAESTFGIGPTEALNRSFPECGIPWDWRFIMDQVARLKRDEEPLRLDDIRYTRPDGTEGFLGLTLNPIIHAGEYAGLLLLGRDISNRKILENQLIQAQKLESIGRLAAGIAHEINTPTQYVGGNIQFLQESFGSLMRLLESHQRLLAAARTRPVSPELIAEVESVSADIDLKYLSQEIPTAVADALEGIRRVSTIVRAMKEFSHPGAQEKSSVDINQAIRSTVTVARNEWKYVAEMVIDLDDDLPHVSCLPNDFNQVILNLIVNAAHAIAERLRVGSEEKGAITITTRADGDCAEIRVADTGMGIPENIRARIFDPFFTTKEVGKGTGQGLTIAHDVIVRKHGGTLTFESEMDKGTTFIIRLPLAAASPQGEEAACNSLTATS